MSLPRTTLSAIQQAGTAVFSADAELKNATQDYARRVTTAMGTNPFGLGNDALFDNWKLVARLSQTMAGIESELRKVYQLASELIAEDNPVVQTMPALNAPVFDLHAGGQTDSAPTDVRVKTGKKKPASGAAEASPKRAAVSPAVAPGRPQALGGNPARLLQHLEQILNSNEFTGISQTASGQAIGIPTGSVNAAIKKLIETGRIVAGPAGSFRLAK